jgi:hypothetical protein
VKYRGVQWFSLLLQFCVPGFVFSYMLHWAICGFCVLCVSWYSRYFYVYFFVHIYLLLYMLCPLQSECCTTYHWVSESLIHDFKLSRWFMVNGDVVLGFLHRITVDSIADVSEDCTASFFSAKVCRDRKCLAYIGRWFLRWTGMEKDLVFSLDR